MVLSGATKQCLLPRRKLLYCSNNNFKDKKNNKKPLKNPQAHHHHFLHGKFTFYVVHTYINQKSYILESEMKNNKGDKVPAIHLNDAILSGLETV